MRTPFRTPLGAFALSIAMLVLASVLMSPTSAHAVSQGKNGWYWPTGHDIASGSPSWLQYRHYSAGEAWHLAFDDLGSYHHPVYALAKGTVLEARTDVGGYGPGGTKGGAIVVLYKTFTGQEFKALYGHVEGLKVSKGASVTPGKILAVLNNCSPSHVHFGINLGRSYPSSSTGHHVSIWMGHTYDYKVVNGKKVPITYNWVDPIAFLNKNRPTPPPAATLTTPTLPARPRARRVFIATGLLTPRHPRGKRCGTIEVQHFVGGIWTSAGVLRALGWDSGSRTRWEAQVRLPKAGRWRLRAHVTAGLDHLEAYSGWAEATVR